MRTCVASWYTEVDKLINDRKDGQSILLVRSLKVGILASCLRSENISRAREKQIGVQS